MSRSLLLNVHYHLLLQTKHYPSSTIGNCLPLLTNAARAAATVCSSKKNQSLPIETTFKLPSPLPSWPSGNGFAKGSIDLGGLEVLQVSTFTTVWATRSGGPDDMGATFFNPSSIPTGYSMLGSYAQPNNKPFFGWVLVARATRDVDGDILAKPVDYTLIWTSESSGTSQDNHGYFWLPTPPEGYRSVGHVVSSSPEKPSLDEVWCVRADLTDECEDDSWIWGSSTDKDGINVHSLRPTTRGTQALGVWVGTFTVRVSTSSNITLTPLACLNNKASNFSSMPNPSQLNALVQAYSPWIYFHPDEPYLPSSVSWFFTNGALLYQKGSSNPKSIDPSGSNLPQGGDNDGTYWIDLPAGKAEKEKVKKGDLSTAEPYLHIKPMLGGTFTDIAVWIFYPFNGPARAKVELINIPLGKIGEHVGDWEHVTLRVSNFTGGLWRVYFSEHSGGVWVDASQLEFPEGNNKVAAYASLNGHAFYAKAGLVLQGSSELQIGIRNDTAKGGDRMDVGERFQVVASEYGGPAAVAEPPWLNYMREWGPKISYDIAEELRVVEKLLPRKLKAALKDVVSRLPDEVLGEDGPTGPKAKDSWRLDEKVDS